MTTVTMMAGGEMARRGWRRPRGGAVVHGSVLLASLAGLTALWATLALTAAVLVMPMQTLGIFEREGAWGMGEALRQGTRVLLSTATGAAR